jgi:hypothetical protein
MALATAADADGGGEAYDCRIWRSWSSLGTPKHNEPSALGNT